MTGRMNWSRQQSRRSHHRHERRVHDQTALWRQRQRIEALASIQKPKEAPGGQAELVSHEDPQGSEGAAAATDTRPHDDKGRA